MFSYWHSMVPVALAGNSAAWIRHQSGLLRERWVDPAWSPIIYIPVHDTAPDSDLGCFGSSLVQVSTAFEKLGSA